MLAQSFTVTRQMLNKRPEMKKDGIKVGDKVKGALLHAKYSRYMQRVAEVDHLQEVAADRLPWLQELPRIVCWF